MYEYTEDDPEINILIKLNEYADRHPEYKNDFFTERGYLTPSQIGALNRIYDQIFQKME